MPKVKRPADKRVPVMVEIGVRQGTRPEEILRTAERWGTLGFQVDLKYLPVRIRPPREQRHDLEAAGMHVVIVRGLVGPRQIHALEQQPEVRKVWLDSRLDPFAKPKAKRLGAGKPKGSHPPLPSPPQLPRPMPPRPPLPPRPPIQTIRKPPRIIKLPPLRPRKPKVDCARTGVPVGTIGDVVSYLGVDQIWAAGFTGRGIVVGVVDGGITAVGRQPQPGQVAAIPNVVGGWPADWGTTAQGWAQHGNMSAFDVLGMAPEAELWDIRIWQADTGNAATNFAAYVSNAIAGYRAAIDNHVTNGVPHILTNSWGLRDRNNGLDYATNPASPFALMVEEALDAGILVVFAAGNCGEKCPENACGTGDRGPGNSVLGPNGHPGVMTVGAANLLEQWCGYTSQGPAVLPPNAAKPDFCSITRFDGFFPSADPTLRDFDGGTSAATAVAAGVVALLKQKKSTLTQGEAKTALQGTAKDIRAPGFDMDSGAGISQAKAAFDTL